ncbi:MAG: RNA polymerase sigma factor [Planctomycetota bacterium]
MNGDLEKKLVASCRNADSSAYTQLIKAYSGRVFAICLGMLGSTHDAEDIAQQTLLRALTNIKQVRRDEQFGAWISRIAKNLCIDFIRMQKRRRSSLAEQAATSRSDSKEYPELEAALAKLSEEYRLALMLYYFDGRSTKAVAEVFMISEAAAQARLCRARKQLRKLLVTNGGT